MLDIPRRSAQRAMRGGGAAFAMFLLSACAAARGERIPEATAMLLPGSHELATAGARDEATTCRLRVSTDTNPTEREAAVERSEMHVTTYDGTSALLIVSSILGAGPAFVDSALVLRDGLAPVWETSHSGERRTRYDYGGRDVRFDVTAPDSAKRHVEHRYGPPVFDFAELGVLVRSLPLRAGYHAIVPLYSEGSDALETDTVQVESSTANGTWTVRFADPVVIIHYSIDARSRRTVGIRVERHAGGYHAHCDVGA